MNTEIPSARQVREALSSLTLKQIDQLAALSGVAAPTIYKIKQGETNNPGIETVGKFFPHLETVLAAARPFIEKRFDHDYAAKFPADVERRAEKGA